MKCRMYKNRQANPTELRERITEEIHEIPPQVAQTIAKKMSYAIFNF